MLDLFLFPLVLRGSLSDGVDADEGCPVGIVLKEVLSDLPGDGLDWAGTELKDGEGTVTTRGEPGGEGVVLGLSYLLQPVDIFF